MSKLWGSLQFCAARILLVLRMRSALRRFGDGVVRHALAAARFGDRPFVSPALRAVENFVLQRIGQVLLFNPAAVVVRVLVPRALRLVRKAAVGIVL